MTFRIRRVHDLDLVATPEDRDWRHDAACGAACRDPREGARPTWWDVASPTVTEPTDDNLAAIEVCTGCPVADHCLDSAHPRHDRYSVRGGLLPADWRKAKRDERAAS